MGDTAYGLPVFGEDTVDSDWAAFAPDKKTPVTGPGTESGATRLTKKQVAILGWPSDADGPGLLPLTLSAGSPGTITRTTPISWYVIDPNQVATASDVVVYAKLGTTDWEVVYADGAYSPKFSGSTATFTPNSPSSGKSIIAGSILKTLGWDDASVTIKVKATGTLLGTPTPTEVTSVFTISNPYTPVPDTVTFTPATGATVHNASTIQVDVTNTIVAPDPTKVIILAKYRNLTTVVLTEDVYNTSTAQSGYTVVRTSIANGYRYVISRNAGWPGQLLDIFVAEDNSQLPTCTAAYTVDDNNNSYVGVPGAASAAPTISNVVPAAGNTVGRTDSIQFDVLDVDSAIRDIAILVSWSDGSPSEVIWDGTAFGPNYLVDSVRQAVSNGYRFIVKRRGGWPSASINIKPIAIDITGSENA